MEVKIKFFLIIPLFISLIMVYKYRLHTKKYNWNKYIN